MMKSENVIKILFLSCFYDYEYSNARAIQKLTWAEDDSKALCQIYLWKKISIR